MKYAFIKEHQNHYPVQDLCSVLGVSRSGYYDWLIRKPSRRDQANTLLLNRIKLIHQQSRQRYGSPRIHAQLQQQGVRVNIKRIARLMQLHDIKAKQARRHKRTMTHREPQFASENHLNRVFKANQPNQKWVSDITFIHTHQGYLYLAMVMDLYSRAIIGWAMSHRINGQLVLDALTMAIGQRGEPEQVLVHSDQGSQYTAYAYQQLLKDHHLISSMSRKGNCHDNAVAESFFHTLKEELIHDANYRTRAEAKQAIFKYIELFYNRTRLHSTLSYQPPLVYERMQAGA